ncbi:hypothetical protein QTP88_015838 [Uroleucon formosanum]
MINEPHYIGSWNIRRLLQQGKLCQIERDIERCNIKILGLSETHQRDKGHFKTSGGNQIMCSGNGTYSRNGVAVIVNKKWSHSIIEYIAVNDRIIVVKLSSTPNKLNLVQIYAPTSAAEEEEIDEFYNILTEISPNGEYKNQIDYCLISSRLKSSIDNIKTRPGADCGSDHQLLVAKLRIHLKNCKKPQHKTIQHIYSRKKWERFETILQQKLKHENNINNWVDLKQMFRTTKNETTKERPRNQKKNCWFSKETIDIIEKRRELKVKGLHCIPQYKQLSAQIRREIRRDKNQIITETCKNIEAFADKNHTRELFQEIKKLSEDFKLKRSAIKDAYGKMQTDPSNIQECWRTYCQKLYTDPDEHSDNKNTYGEQEPGILSEEIEQAMLKLKNNKAPGSDEITAEMLKLSGDKGFRLPGVWPEDWVESIFIPLHKKGFTEDCSNYRTILPISHASKVLLNVIHARLRYYADSQIPLEQAGFVKGRGTRE